MRVKLEALDNQVITPRTGKSVVIAHTESLPKEGGWHMFLYDESEACESPGVFIATDGVETLGREMKFYDHDKRPFKITLLD
jgi:hypothetical protein